MPLSPGGLRVTSLAPLLYGQREPSRLYQVAHVAVAKDHYLSVAWRPTYPLIRTTATSPSQLNLTSTWQAPSTHVPAACSRLHHQSVTMENSLMCLLATMLKTQELY